MAAIDERCPKCERAYEVGPYYKHEKAHGPKCELLGATDSMLLGGLQCSCDTIVAPNDIECSCGLVLRWVVPLIRVTQSGYQLVPKPDNSPFRNSKEKY